MQTKAILTLIACAALALAPSALSAAPAASSTDNTTVSADEALLAMQQAFKKGDSKRLSALLPQTRGHPLEVWAAYWELKARLEQASAAEVQAFFTRFAGSYQEDRLRADWLQLLGQRRDWAAFAAQYPAYRMGDERELRCYAALLEYRMQGSDVAESVRRHWHALRDADDGCTLAAGVLLADKKLPPLQAWRKARLAIEANRPRAARAAVELVAPQAAAAVSELFNDPARFLGARIAAGSKQRQELVLLALIRLAGMQPQQAASILDNKWSVHLSAEERNWAWAVIAKESLLHLSGNAFDYASRVGKNSELTDDLLGWQARAALRAGAHPNWPAVQTAVAAMSDEARREPIWVYWHARALLAQAGKQRTEQQAAAERAQAQQALESIASVRGFYEQLALEELGRKISLPARPTPPTEAEMQAVRAHPGLQRALAAIALGLRPEGVREWNYSTNLVTPQGSSGQWSDRELRAAAQLACDNGVWDRCINTSERSRNEIDLVQRFPMPYQEAVVKRSQQNGLDPAFVYGLIRQESRFIMDARSGVGAAGLMQVMPATARWTAKKIGLTDFQPHQISERDTNIAIGTGYLKLVLDAFAGSMPLAAAAYNAGPGRPRLWRGTGAAASIDAAIWAETIPFSETRDYVKKVLANTTSYALLLGDPPQSLKSRLGRIGTRDAASAESGQELP